MRTLFYGFKEVRMAAQMLMSFLISTPILTSILNSCWYPYRRRHNPTYRAGLRFPDEFDDGIQCALLTNYRLVRARPLTNNEYYNLNLQSGLNLRPQAYAIRYFVNQVSGAERLGFYISLCTAGIVRSRML